MTEIALPQVDGVCLDHAHFIGIGGAGMSAIARILADRGLAVSGSDAKASRALTGLETRGVRTAVGQRPENLDLLPGGAHSVVISTAIRPDNPELLAARARGLPVIRRAQALAALMDNYRSVCVAGTHGKTSTTSMLTVALQHCDLDPSFAIGGELNESGSGAHHGSGDIFVAESDESDGSFLYFRPHGAIITNIEPDHLDHHGTAAAYAQVFADFADRITAGGFLVACLADAGVRHLLAQRPIPGLVTYGWSAALDAELGTGQQTVPDVQITAVVVRGNCQSVAVALGRRTVDFTLAQPGAHMALNAAAALAAAWRLGVDIDDVAAGLSAFTGVRRRFEFRGRAGGVSVYDDYAHHPTEVSAALRAARAVVAPGGRLVVAFQPHLYSRTKLFAAEFARALSLADLAIVLDVYGAREDPIPDVDGALIADQITAAHLFEPRYNRAAITVSEQLRPGDVLVTMGAGDITGLAGPILGLLGSA